MVQLVVPGQPKPLGHRLDALAATRSQQPAHIQRRHPAPRAATGHIEEWLKPIVEVAINIARQGEGGSYVHACKMGAQAHF
jgi:hypothetical protein